MNLGRNDAEMKRRMNNGLLWLLAGLLLFAMPLQAAASEQGAGSGIPLSGVWQGDGAAAEVQPVLETDEAVEQFLLGSGTGSKKRIAANANELQLIRKLVAPGGETNYIYQQSYREIPVYGKYAKVRLDKLRRPVYVDDGLALELGSQMFATAPSISEDQAIDALVEEVERVTGLSIDREATVSGMAAFDGEASLLLYPYNGGYRLAYQVMIGYLEPAPGSWAGFVDAVNGAVLDKYSKRPFLSIDNALLGKGKGNRMEYDDSGSENLLHIYHDQKGDLDPNHPGRYYLLDVTRPMFRPLDDFDPGVIATYYYEPASLGQGAEMGGTIRLTWSDTPEFNLAEALDAHVLTGEVYDFYLANFNWDSFDGKGSTVTSVVYYAPETDNAFWVFGLDAIYYGMPKAWDCLSCSADIVVHEFTHGVIDYTAGLEYRNQSGALNESIADIMAAVFSRDAHPWKIGEEARGGVPIRDMENPENHGQPRHMKDYRVLPPTYDKDYGGVHINSGIPNHAAYLIADGIDKSPLGLDGRRTLGQITFRALHFLTPIDEFQDARDAYLLAAEDVAAAEGLDEAETDLLIGIVEDAWAKVGLPADSYDELNIRAVALPFDTTLTPVIYVDEATVYIPIPYGFPVNGLELPITPSKGARSVPEKAKLDENGTATVRIINASGDEKAWTLIAAYIPAVHYSEETFREAGANDGSIGNTITAKLYLDTFTGTRNEDFVQTGKVFFENVPRGLTASAIRISDTEVRLALRGKANAHRAADSIDGIKVRFAGNAFQLVEDQELTIDYYFGTERSFDVLFHDPAPAAGGGGGGGGGFFFIPPVASQQETNQTDDGAVISLPRLQPQTDSEGRSTVAVALEEKTLADGFALLADHPDKPKNVIIPIGEQADVYAVSFPASAIRRGQQAAGEASLVIRAGNVAYELPIAGFDSATLAGNASLSVSISRVIGETRQALADRAAETRMQVIGDAYDFRIAVTRDGKETEISRLTKPLIRTVTLEGRHTNQTAVVRFDPDRGRFAHVPALFSYADGKTTVTFARNSNSIYAIVRYTPIFADVAGHWAKADIEQLAMRQIVSGVTADAFQPNAQVTRAQFAAMLVNALELEPSASETPFGDVPASAWYAAPVAIGVEKGLFSGFADGTFRPNETITREQMAVMLTNAMAHAGLAETRVGETESWLARFTDREAISGWSAESVAAAVRAGLLFGRDDGRFAPADPATRAEAAAIVMRLLNQLEQ